MDLKDIRKRIDCIDDEIAALLDKRFSLVEEVAAAKLGASKLVRDTEREKSIIARVTDGVSHPESIREVFGGIFRASRNNQFDIILRASKGAGEQAKAIKVINGVNLNMLGIREPDIYGQRTYADLEKYIEDCAAELGLNVSVSQFNNEGDIVEEIHSCYQRYDGIVINPGAYTHTSIAIADALKAVNLPVVEAHLSEVDRREIYRRISFIAPIAFKTVMGLGFESYRAALCEFKSFFDNGRKI